MEADADHTVGGGRHADSLGTDQDGEGCKVTDAADGEPLIGATVMVKETKAGRCDRLDGNYSTKVAKGRHS